MRRNGAYRGRLRPWGDARGSSRETSSDCHQPVTNGCHDRVTINQGRIDLRSSRLLAAASFAIAVNVHAADITGAGATFPYPIYAKWAEAYKAKTGQVMNYQSIGSGGGIAQIKAKTVDFGASDMPLKPDDLRAAGLMQFPAIVGGVVPIVNLAGIAPGALKLTGPVLADIYLGKIKKWNDKAIGDLNAGLKLPDEPIAVVGR